MAESGEVQGVQAVDRAVRILRIVADNHREGIRIADVSRHSGLTIPTSHRIVRALERHRLIEREEASGRYFLGPETFVLGTIASSRFDLVRAAHNAIAVLARETQEAVLLTGRQYWHGVCMQREEGTYPIRSQVTRVGDRHPLGITAGGMAILATFDDGKVDEALAANAAEIETFAHFTPDVIRGAIDDARRSGYAFNPGLIIPGSWAIAVAIRGPDGEGVGALSVAAVEQRLDKARREQIAALLVAEAQKVERRLYDPAILTTVVHGAGRTAAATRP